MLPKEDFCPFIYRITHHAAACLCLIKGKWCCVVHLYNQASVYNVTSNLTRHVSKEYHGHLLMCSDCSKLLMATVWNPLGDPRESPDPTSSLFFSFCYCFSSLQCHCTILYQLSLIYTNTYTTPLK